MAVNKVKFGNQTVMDITDTTATSGDVIQGQIFYSANGTRSTGSLTDATQSIHGLMSATDKQHLDTLYTQDNLTALQVVNNALTGNGVILNQSHIYIGDAQEAPIISVKFTIDPKQENQPTTIIEQSKNLLNINACTSNYYLSSSGVPTSSSGDKYSELIPVTPGETFYYYGIAGKNGNRRFHGYNSEGNWVQQITTVAAVLNQAYDSGAITIPSGIAYVRLSFNGNDSDVMLERDTQTEYEPYYYNEKQIDNFVSLSTIELNVSAESTSLENSDLIQYNLNLPQNLYGISIEIINDTSINIQKTWDFIQSYNGETLSENWISNIVDDQGKATPSIGAQVVYQLTTPINIDTSGITSLTLPTLYEDEDFIWLTINELYSNNILRLEYEKQPSLSYILPIASNDILGGIKIGNGLTINSEGIVSVDSQSSSSITLEPATASILGGVKIGNNINITNDGTISINDYAPINNPIFTNSISLDRSSNQQIGKYAVAIGSLARATAMYSFAVNGVAEGSNSVAFSGTSLGDYSFTNGFANYAYGNYCYAEGYYSTAGEVSGVSEACHAEGYNSIGSSVTYNNKTYNYGTAVGKGSHCEGYGNVADGGNYAAHAEGTLTYANGIGAHAEGYSSQAYTTAAHVEGMYNECYGLFSHVEGYKNVSRAQCQHIIGKLNARTNLNTLSAWSPNSVAYEVGDQVKENNCAYQCKIAHTSSNSYKPTTSTAYWEILPVDNYAMVVGNGDITSTIYSNAYALDWDGNGYYYGNLYVNCNRNSAEGTKVATETYVNTSINNLALVASTGDYSDLLNTPPITIGSRTSSIIENNNTASGDYSHAAGNSTIANHKSQYVFGEFNLADDSNNSANARGNYIEIVGNGTNDSARANARTLDWNGNEILAGDLTINKGQSNEATLSTVISTIPTNAKNGSANYSIAEGNATTAKGTASHAEGDRSVAAGGMSHAEGQTCTANAYGSHAEGYHTYANGTYSHAGGSYNVIDSYDAWAEWTANTSYVVGDKVKRTSGSSVAGYICKTANSDSSFSSSKWTAQSGKMNYIEIVGCGTAENNRINARALDWDGNGRYKKDLYVNCNNDSTGGQKVATEEYVNARIPTPPTTNGTYTLQVTINNGAATYSWA